MILRPQFSFARTCPGTGLGGRAFDCQLRVGSRWTLSLDPYKFRAAGHSSHTFGPNFGTAAAAGALAGLDATQARYLMSFAAQQASGVSCWMRDKDHIEKAFGFGGMPARNGVSAALMVASGFTGVDDVFSGERCFFDAYGNDADRDILSNGLGTRYEILDTSIKRWTVGSPIQAPLDSLHALLAEHTVSADQVTRIDVRTPHESFTIVNDRDMPEICLQHLVSVMLCDAGLSFEGAHDRACMDDPAVRAVRGTPANPMTRAEIEEKAMDLMAPVLGQARACALCGTIWSLERTDDVRTLRPLLAAWSRQLEPDGEMSRRPAMPPYVRTAA